MTVVRRDGATVVLELTEFERELLNALLVDYEEVVSAEQDDVHDRLFPEGYRDDVDAAAEFRKYTRSGLVERKTANAGAVTAALAQGSTIDLATDAFDAWLPVLTDLRLVLAERLGIQTDDDEVPEDPAGDVYQWLGELQWFLLEALDEDEDEDADADEDSE
ncbi:hypothetical protein BH11ACT3_BH11ACT3_13630 [soil metagenome]